MIVMSVWANFKDISLRGMPDRSTVCKAEWNWHRKSGSTAGNLSVQSSGIEIMDVSVDK